MTRFELEDRLIEFAARCIKLAETLPNTYACKHLAGQITRSGSSPALNYAEAQSGESRADFVHKMSICVKELRESLVCMKIIQKCGFFAGDRLKPLLQECDELISIFVKSIETAKKSK